MQRVKKVDYDEDDLYSDDGEGDYADDSQEVSSAEDRAQFAALTPVVRAELEEHGVQVTDKEIEDALWHYYWDVGKSAAYLKSSRAPRPDAQPSAKNTGTKVKAKSKFDEAAERSAANTGGAIPWDFRFNSAKEQVEPMSGADWFRDTPWSNVPDSMEGHLIQVEHPRPRPLLLGGSSKLAKLAEERRRKAAATRNSQGATEGASSSLDRLTKPKDLKENAAPTPKAELKRYPVRKKKAPTPPPEVPTLPPKQPEVEKSDLRGSPTAFGQALSTSPPQVKCSSIALKDVIGSEIDTDPFTEPSPDDTILRAQLHKNIKSKPAVTSLEKRTGDLKLDDTLPAPIQPRVRSKGLDVPNLWAKEQSKRKATAAFVVIGHVDHGKSTLMGRLLLDTGAVAQRDVDKYKKQAAEIGRASFALAWVMDTGSEERERGVTVDIAQHHFSTDKVDFTTLDAPGHRDFVPSMIGGASMADFAVLVVDANQLESGMKGQTREHILLAKAVGLSKIVVAVNKLDSTMPSWDRNLFLTVRDAMLKLLKESGFSEQNIVIVACSGLSGDNVAKSPPEQGETAWVAEEHQTLLQQLERSVPAEVSQNLIERPLRMQIADVFRGGITNPLSVAGRIDSGHVQVGDTVLLQPSGESATVKGVEVNGSAADWAVAHSICTLHLTDIEAQHVQTGDVVCTPHQPISVTKTFSARVDALDSLLPQGVDVHIGRSHVPGAIKRLVQTVDRNGELLKRKPRVVKAGQRAVVDLTLEEGAPLEGGNRVVLRSGGITIAAGFVEPMDR